MLVRYRPAPHYRSPLPASVRSADCDIYKGQFRADVKDGVGTQWFGDGAVYYGEWQSNNMNGHGIKRASDGDEMEGHWVSSEGSANGVVHGIVKLRAAGGSEQLWAYDHGKAVKAVELQKEGDSVERVPGIGFGIVRPCKEIAMDMVGMESDAVNVAEMEGDLRFLDVMDDEMRPATGPQRSSHSDEVSTGGTQRAWDEEFIDSQTRADSAALQMWPAERGGAPLGRPIDDFRRLSRGRQPRPTPRPLDNIGIARPMAMPPRPMPSPHPSDDIGISRPAMGVPPPRPPAGIGISRAAQRKPGPKPKPARKSTPQPRPPPDMGISRPTRAMPPPHLR